MLCQRLGNLCARTHLARTIRYLGKQLVCVSSGSALFGKNSGGSSKCHRGFIGRHSSKDDGGTDQQQGGESREDEQAPGRKPEMKQKTQAQVQAQERLLVLASALQAYTPGQLQAELLATLNAGEQLGDVQKLQLQLLTPEERTTVEAMRKEVLRARHSENVEKNRSKRKKMRGTKKAGELLEQHQEANGPTLEPRREPEEEEAERLNVASRKSTKLEENGRMMLPPPSSSSSSPLPPSRGTVEVKERRSFSSLLGLLVPSPASSSSGNQPGTAQLPTDQQPAKDRPSPSSSSSSTSPSIHNDDVGKYQKLSSDLGTSSPPSSLPKGSALKLTNRRLPTDEPTNFVGASASSSNSIGRKTDKGRTSTNSSIHKAPPPAGAPGGLVTGVPAAQKALPEQLGSKVEESKDVHEEEVKSAKPVTGLLAMLAAGKPLGKEEKAQLQLLSEAERKVVQKARHRVAEAIKKKVKKTAAAARKSKAEEKELSRMQAKSMKDMEETGLDASAQQGSTMIKAKRSPVAAAASAAVLAVASQV